MHFTPALESATLLKRYKRFLADIELDTFNIDPSAAALSSDRRKDQGSDCSR